MENDATRASNTFGAVTIQSNEFSSSHFKAIALMNYISLLPFRSGKLRANSL